MMISNWKQPFGLYTNCQRFKGEMLSIATTGSQIVVCCTQLSATHGSLTARGLDEHWWTSRHGATLDCSICWHLIVIEVTALARVFEEWSNCIRWLNCLLSSSCFLRGHTTGLACTDVQRKRAVTACFSSGRLLPFGFTWQCNLVKKGNYYLMTLSSIEIGRLFKGSTS